MLGCAAGWKYCAGSGEAFAGKGAAMRAAAATAAAVAWILATLLCLPAPARAFWGDYGPEPPPEIFGVRLGDDIRNYEGMKYVIDEAWLYRRAADKGLAFGGVRSARMMQAGNTALAI